MSKKSSSSNAGVSTLGLLGVLFVGLKLTGFIDWAWWWVTAPFWGGLAAVAVVFAIFGFGLVLVKAYLAMFGK